MLKVLLQLEPLACPSCGKKIEEEISVQKGVISVIVFPRLSKVRTELNEKEMNVEQLEHIMKDLGYAVKSRKTEKGNAL